MVGPLPYQDRDRLSARLPDASLVDVTSDFVRLRLVKSEEEIEWMQRAATITDASLMALLDTARPGVSELELQAATVSGAIKAGGQPHFLYLSSTPMDRPDRIVPQQDLTERRLQPGDAVIFELSASLGGYSGQVLRTVTVETELTDRYRGLHEVAWEAFHAIAGIIRPGTTAAEVVEAGSTIEAHGFTICDDLVHGYGGGYLPPVLRTPSTTHGSVPNFVFDENMTLVIQPNVVSGEAGVQVGELVQVTPDGVRRFHKVPQAALRSPA